jgi:hypothetical protein
MPIREPSLFVGQGLTVDQGLTISANCKMAKTIPYVTLSLVLYGKGASEQASQISASIDLAASFFHNLRSLELLG